MISCVEWVPQGVADPCPKAYELSAAEKELIENQAQLDDSDDEAQGTTTTTFTTTTLPKIDPTSLPPELRMDEYSSDEEEGNTAVQGSAIGNLLVRNDGHDDNEAEEVEMKGQQDEEEWEDDDDSDMDSDDDFLEDVPDTREYEPTDLEGLQAMGLSHVGAGAAMNLEEQEEYDDDDSDIDDINLSPDDAIIVVAKTEEVREHLV